MVSKIFKCQELLPQVPNLQKKFRDWNDDV